MILIDANVFMYAAGADHKHKRPCVEYLQRVARAEVDAAVDAEVLQEILHRYRAIRRWDDGRRVYDLVRRIVPVVLSIDADVLDAARALLDDLPELTARDALHAAVYFASGATELCSYDADFDMVPGLVRVEP